MAIYLKQAQETPPKSINDLIRMLYPVTSRVTMATTTYKDPGCNYLQCDKSYRSFDDILELVKTYFPEVTEKDVIKKLLSIRIIYNDIDGEKLLYPNIGTCGTMNRIRFIYVKLATVNTSNDAYMRSMPDSKYSWKQLLEPLGITNSDTLIEYCNKHRENEEVKESSI